MCRMRGYRSPTECGVDATAPMNGKMAGTSCCRPVGVAHARHKLDEGADSKECEKAPMVMAVYGLIQVKEEKDY